MDEMTLAEYLQVLDNYTFSDASLRRVAIKCNNLYGFSIPDITTTVDSLTQEQLDLCEAWTWVYALGIVNMTAGGKKSVGNRSVTYAAFNPLSTDRKNWLARANEIFRTYGYAEVTDGETASLEDYTNYWSNGRYDILPA